MRDLSTQELQNLEARRDVLRRHERDSLNLEHLSQEFVELEALIENFRTQLAESRGGLVDPRAAHCLMSRVQRHVINHLALFRAFEDHTDRRLLRRFGRDSVQSVSYRKARSLAARHRSRRARGSAVRARG